MRRQRSWVLFTQRSLARQIVGTALLLSTFGFLGAPPQAASGRDEVTERRFELPVVTGLESAVRIGPQPVEVDRFCRLTQQLVELVDVRDPRGAALVHARPDAVRQTGAFGPVTLQRIEHPIDRAGRDD